MNIGIVTTWFERGAAYVSRQYRDILRTKHNVFIYARGGEMHPTKGDPQWNDNTVTRNKRAYYHSINAINMVDFQNWIKTNKLNLVFFNEQYQWKPIILCNEMGIKTGAYVDYYTKETMPLFGCYDFLICNTRRHYGVFNWHLQAFFIPWGTDINLFKPFSLSPVSTGYVTFFHSAGMSPDRKGTDLVLRAFARVQGKTRLVIHTQEKLKKYFPNLVDLIRSLEDKNRLVCYEKTVQSPGLYHLGDVYVYPSIIDGIGLTIAEALACGLPVITSDSAPMNEFIDRSNGMLVKISHFAEREDNYYWPQCFVDIDHLSECMQEYVNQIDMIGGFKKAARSYAEKYLDWSKNARDLSVLFEKVIERSPVEKIEVEQQARNYDKKYFSIHRRFIRLIKRLFVLIFKKKWGQNGTLL